MTKDEQNTIMKSGWGRTAVTTAVGILALATSTYTVVQKITTFELKLEQAIEQAEKNNTRLRALEARQGPEGEQRSDLTATMRLVLQSLDEIKRRLERIESRRDP